MIVHVSSVMKRLLVLLVPVITVAGCVTVVPPQGAGPSGGGALTPQVVAFEADPSNVQAGDITTIRWQVSNAASVTIDQGVGAVALTGNRAISPKSTITYTLTAANQYGTSSATTTVVVASAAAPTPPSFNLPEVLIFAALPANMASGQTAILSWHVSNAFEVTINPGFPIIPASGSREVNPIFPTTYKLTATNDQGSILATTTLTVSSTPPDVETPVIKFFKATPYVINRGASSILSWESTEGSSASIDNGFGIVNGSGTVQVTPGQTTTYMLTVTNPRGAQFQTVTVNVK
jgi:hypothetical protein